MLDKAHTDSKFFKKQNDLYLEKDRLPVLVKFCRISRGGQGTETCSPFKPFLFVLIFVIITVLFFLSRLFINF